MFWPLTRLVRLGEEIWLALLFLFLNGADHIGRRLALLPLGPIRQMMLWRPGRKQGRRRKRWRPRKPSPFAVKCWIAAGLVMLGLLYAAYWEGRISLFQAHYLTRYAARMNATLEPGENTALRFPETGPYNRRLGYAYLPYFIKSLKTDGYAVAQQMRHSQALDQFIRYGGFPVYQAKTKSGLQIFDRHGGVIYSAAFPSRSFARFEDIPPLLINALLFVENRELLHTPFTTHNPAIAWGRFILAALGQAAGVFAPSLNLGGGSTLATQIEKFRNSPGGQTGGIFDKLRQIASASIRAYQNGPNTRAASKRIILDYLNATPLSARPGIGEINGIGDGLWGWFGIELTDAIQALGDDSSAGLKRKATMFKHCLALILAERRPSYYLLSGPKPLEQLTAATLLRLRNKGVIAPALYDEAMRAPLQFRPALPETPQNSFIAQKASNAMRRYLLNSFGLDNLYELDRLDLAVGSTLDLPMQRQVTEFLQKLHDPEFSRTAGLNGEHLLEPDDDPTRINWTIVLFERTKQGNALRVQADNLDQPLDLNDGVKLDLGSTAKLRTLTTYLEIIADLHVRYHALDAEALEGVKENAPDRLTAWAADWLAAQKDRSLAAMLGAAMQRKYSASPAEGFYTGGGLHHFNNFNPDDNHRIVTMAEAMRKSINLPFIRLMRDIVNYIVARGPNPKEEILGDPGHPARRAYLERFADNEGAIYLNRFYALYRNQPLEQVLDILGRRVRRHPVALAVMFRSVRPEAGADAFITFLRKLRPYEPRSNAKLREIFFSYPKERYNLADRGYIAGIHPLELWLVQFRTAYPQATRREMLAASISERLTTYSWLFKTSKYAQDNRIRGLLEQDAFTTIQQNWAKLGYPFERLVPSLATAIGSSADRPGALAELMGVILNDGIRMPMLRADYIHCARDTPFQTMLAREESKGIQTLSPEIARELRRALLSIVEDGTAKRVKGAFMAIDGSPIPVGGKTGTGDHRFDTYGPGGRLVSSRVISRTATFVFFIGDRFFGTVTAFVDGEQAGTYRFTSALPSQMLRALAPVLQPMLQQAAVEEKPANNGAGKD